MLVTTNRCRHVAMSIFPRHGHYRGPDWEWAHRGEEEVMRSVDPLIHVASEKTPAERDTIDVPPIFNGLIIWCLVDIIPFYGCTIQVSEL